VNEGTEGVNQGIGALRAPKTSATQFNDRFLLMFSTRKVTLIDLILSRLFFMQIAKEFYYDQ
jgi:hypothetical protein